MNFGEHNKTVKVVAAIVAVCLSYAFYQKYINLPQQEEDFTELDQRGRRRRRRGGWRGRKRGVFDYWTGMWDGFFPIFNRYPKYNDEYCYFYPEKCGIYPAYPSIYSY
jgi:hypothetical protein